MYILPIYFLFFSIFFSIFFSRWLGKSAFSFFLISAVFFSLIFSFYIYYEVVYLGLVCDIFLMKWFHFYNLDFNFHFYYDSLSVTMLVLVLFISFFVQIFSLEYMWGDPSFIRFMVYINIFTFFMLIMVLSANLIQFFLGWEGIGLASYLLINFWYYRPEANRSAIKAVLMNRVGDFGLYVAIVYFYFFFKTFDFVSLNLLVKADLSPHYFNFFDFSISKIDFLCFFLLLACVGKSAQLGLHSWLPDAMEGPTPVSALLHSATMVTAGIFLILRFSHFFEFSVSISRLMIIISILTCLFASFSAMGQYDIKKIIAYSTTSQLSYMLLACGSSQYLLALQHLFDHAFFKAVLFLGAGSLIHLMRGKQDIREFGGLFKLAPFTYLSFLIASFSLLGFPSTSGFYSKESIIEAVLLRTTFQELVSLFTCLSVSFSAYYSLQVIFLTFHGIKNYNFGIVYDGSAFINTSLFFLTFGGLVTGFLFFNLYSFPSSFFQNSFYSVKAFELISVDDLSWYLIINLPLYFTFFFVFLAMYFQDYFILFFSNNLSCFFNFINFFNRKWFFDFFLFFLIFVGFFYNSYLNFFKIFDRALLEFFGPLKIVKIFLSLGELFGKTNNGHFSFNIFLSIFFIVFLILILFYIFLGLAQSLFLYFYIFSLLGFLKLHQR